MKVAIVHDWFEPVGGAEFVIENILVLYPDADVWCLWDDSELFSGARGAVHESWMSLLPKLMRRPVALIFGPLYWRYLPSREYDLVIKSSHLFAHLARFHGNRGPSVSYVYSPARYIWFPEIDGRFQNPLLIPILKLLRNIDRRWHQSDVTLAISNEIARRIDKVWGVNAEVVYPPVRLTSTDGLPPAETPISERISGEYLLAAGRLVEYKRYDLAIQVAEAAGKPLIIAGGGPSLSHLKELASAAQVTVHFVHQPSDEDLRWLYANALALVYMGVEDFGIVPLEAMAFGTPVIGVNAGGLAETVLDGRTGFLVNSVLEAAGKVDEVGLLQNSGVYQENLRRFSPETFRQGFKLEVEKLQMRNKVR